MQFLVRITISLSALAVVFALLHWLGRGRRRQRFFRRGFGVDVGWWYLRFTVVEVLGRALLAVPFVLAGLALGFSLDDLRHGRFAGFGPLARWPAWAQIGGFLIAADFAGYWNHRLFHTRRWWPFHAVHHSPQELDWLSALRVHPVNEIAGQVLTALPVLLLGFNPKLVAPFAPLLGFYAIFIHANVNWTYGPVLRYVVASPVFHRWHHALDRAAWDKNFAGLLPLWDWLFGTLYLPQDRLPETFGIPEAMPEKLLGQLAFPFRRSPSGVSHPDPGNSVPPPLPTAASIPR